MPTYTYISEGDRALSSNWDLLVRQIQENLNLLEDRLDYANTANTRLRFLELGPAKIFSWETIGGWSIVDRIDAVRAAAGMAIFEWPVGFNLYNQSRFMSAADLSLIARAVGYPGQRVTSGDPLMPIGMPYIFMARTVFNVAAYLSHVIQYNTRIDPVWSGGHLTQYIRSKTGTLSDQQIAFPTSEYTQSKPWPSLGTPVMREMADGFHACALCHLEGNGFGNPIYSSAMDIQPLSSGNSDTSDHNVFLNEGRVIYPETSANSPIILMGTGRPPRVGDAVFDLRFGVGNISDHEYPIHGLNHLLRYAVIADVNVHDGAKEPQVSIFAQTQVNQSARWDMDMNRINRYSDGRSVGQWTAFDKSNLAAPTLAMVKSSADGSVVTLEGSAAADGVAKITADFTRVADEQYFGLGISSGWAGFLAPSAIEFDSLDQVITLNYIEDRNLPPIDDGLVYRRIVCFTDVTFQEPLVWFSARR